ncbi:MAG: hypothetical protein IJJ38_09680, partial [Lachnospiraceae bacterium]|nr:hypothetical protein [Lachnospiraceae bacterium]
MSDRDEILRENLRRNREAIEASRYGEEGLSYRGAKMNSGNFEKLMEGRGLSEDQISELKDSFAPGTMETRHAREGEQVMTTHGTQPASGIFTTKESLGATPGERIDRGALPHTNSAEYETKAVLARDQNLVYGEIAPQSHFSKMDPQQRPRMGGAQQIITDGGYRAGAVVNRDPKFPVPVNSQGAVSEAPGIHAAAGSPNTSAQTLPGVQAGPSADYETVPASSIQGVDSSGEHFWNHHGNTKDDYMNLASRLPEVQEQLGRGVPLEEIKKDPELRDCAAAYYNPDKMIAVERGPNGLEFQDDGRHRVAAAQELGYDIPVRPINREMGESPNGMPGETEGALPDHTAGSGNEHDEAMRNLTDYMADHNYGAEDYPEYSQDPEWQNLHRAAYPEEDHSGEAPEKNEDAEAGPESQREEAAGEEEKETADDKETGAEPEEDGRESGVESEEDDGLSENAGEEGEPGTESENDELAADEDNEEEDGRESGTESEEDDGLSENNEEEGESGTESENDEPASDEDKEEEDGREPGTEPEEDDSLSENDEEEGESGTESENGEPASDEDKEDEDGREPGTEPEEDDGLSENDEEEDESGTESENDEPASDEDKEDEDGRESGTEP